MNVLGVRWLTRMGQFISEFLTESVETLERIANPKKPPMKLSEIEEKRNEVNEVQGDEELAAVKAELKEMDNAYLSGRGNLDVWTPEIMEEIDQAFVNNFMESQEPLDFLFFPNSPEYLNAYGVYLQEVDDILVKHQEDLPKYCREYLAYYSIWEMRGYKFPVPIGTASVVECLHKIASERRKGFIEVSILLLDSARGAGCCGGAGVPLIDSNL